MFNRRAIEDYAEAELGLAKRKEQPLSIIFLDIDHFKPSTISMDIRAATTYCVSWLKFLLKTCDNMTALAGGEAMSFCGVARNTNIRSDYSGGAFADQNI